MKVKKGVLYVGKWHLPDGRIFEVKSGDIPHYAQRMQDMLGSGLSIPVSWEHQSRARPMTRDEHEKFMAEKTRLTLGRAESAFVDPRGVLETELDVPDEEDVKKLPACGFVSPHIENDFVDGTGRKWDGPSILHLAVTPRPVQTPQKPFETVAMSWSLSWGDMTMADEPKKEDKKSKEGDGAPEGITKKIKEAFDCVREIGLVLGDDVPQDAEQFLDRLIVAVKTKKEVEEPGSLDKKKDEPMKTEQTPPILMSMQNTINAQETRLSAATAQLVTMGKKDLQRRIESLLSTGRISKAIFDKLKAELGSVSLSLADNGELAQAPLIAKVEAYEMLDKGASWPVDMSRATVVEPPTDMQVEDKEQAKKNGQMLAEMALGKR